MELTVDPVLLLLQAVPFLLLIVALKAWVFDPLLLYLEERRRRIDGYRQDAVRMEHEAAQQLKDIEARLADARAALVKERREALQRAVDEEQEIVAQARAASEARIDAFQGELQAVRKAAAAELRTQVEAMSSEIASQILGHPVN